MYGLGGRNKQGMGYFFQDGLQCTITIETCPEAVIELKSRSKYWPHDQTWNIK